MKRIDELPTDEDGFRILLDEYWPKHLSEEEAKVDLWFKEMKPTEYFDQLSENDFTNIDSVEREYYDELGNEITLIKIIRDIEKEEGTVTFLYSTLESIKRLQINPLN